MSITQNNARPSRSTIASADRRSIDPLGKIMSPMAPVVAGITRLRRGGGTDDSI